MNRIVKFGFDAKLYVCAAGIGGTPAGEGGDPPAAGPVWTLVKGVKNLTLNLSSAEADVSVRDIKWKLVAAGLIEASIEFDLTYRPSADGFSDLRTAYFGGDPIGLAIMDGDIITAGTQGLWADCCIFNFGQEQPLDNAMGVKVTAKPTLTDNEPAWKVIASA